MIPVEINFLQEDDRIGSIINLKYSQGTCSSIILQLQTVLLKHQLCRVVSCEKLNKATPTQP